MVSLLTVLAALTANALGATMALPQTIKLFRTRRVEGVSAAWIGIGASLNLWWVLYGVGTSNWAITPVAALSGFQYLAMTVMMIRMGGRTRLNATVSFFAGLLIPLAILLLGGWTAAGIAIGLGYAVQLAPAVVAVYRSTDVSGVAPGTWMIASSEGAAWIVYGVLISDIPIVFGGAAGFVIGGLILLRLARHRRPSGFARDVLRAGRSETSSPSSSQPSAP